MAEINPHMMASKVSFVWLALPFDAAAAKDVLPFPGAEVGWFGRWCWCRLWLGWFGWV
jgi:hypothetical protein